MIEFGEKLKQAREEKGMAQQTLADYIYVTRQAVSRWERGARYPDLLTAKKVSEILEVSLDELLSGEEMQKCVQENPVMKSDKDGKLQSAMYGFAAMVYLLISIVEFRFIAPIFAEQKGMFWLVFSWSLMIKGIYTAVFLYGLYLAVNGKMTPGKTGLVSAVYLGSGALESLVQMIQAEAVSIAVLWAIACAVFAIIVISYYFENRVVSPAPIYAISIFMVLRVVIMFIQMLENNTEFALVIRVIWLLAVIDVAGLMTYQAKCYYQKRRRIVKFVDRYFYLC